MPKDDQGLWNFVFTLFFVAIFVGLGWLLWDMGRLPIGIDLFDFVLLVLATFRITRLFVYDKITQFVRDAFLQKRVIEGDNGDLLIMRAKYASGPLRTVQELLACPWCFGMWAGLFAAFFYYATPFAWFPMLVLAISGLGTGLQLLVSMIGWKAESLKVSVEGKDSFDSASLPR